MRLLGGARSVGMDTFGRTSYVGRDGPAVDTSLVELLSNSVGEVPLLDTEESLDGKDSGLSVVMEDAMESRALSGRRYMFPAVGG